MCYLILLSHFHNTEPVATARDEDSKAEEKLECNYAVIPEYYNAGTIYMVYN